MTKTEIEKKLKDGINERVKMTRFFEAMDDNEAAVRCMGFAHAFAVALSWIQTLEEEEIRHDEENHLLHGSGADQRRRRS